jgi:hypothetical protein
MQIAFCPRNFSRQGFSIDETSLVKGRSEIDVYDRHVLRVRRNARQ